MSSMVNAHNKNVKTRFDLTCTAQAWLPMGPVIAVAHPGRSYTWAQHGRG